MRTKISRRTVLRGFGTVMALPWMESLVPRSAFASTLEDSPPTRMAFLYVPNGMHMQDWTPEKFGENFDLPEILKPLADYQSKFNVLNGLTLNGARALGDGGGDHARSVAAFLTGAHPKKTHGADIFNGPSVDQVAAEKIGGLTRLPSLELGTESSAPAGKCDSGYSCAYTSNMAWRNATSPIAKEINPQAVFDRLFGSTDKREKRLAELKREKYRKSVLDFVREDAKKLHKDLAANDQRKLDEYLFAVREIERQLDRSEKLDRPEEDVPDYPRPVGVPREYEEHLKLMFDMMVIAFQTDSTRIISLMYTNAGSNRSYRNIGVRQGHHSLSHHGGNKLKQGQISKINQYHSTLFKYFLDKMDSVREGDGTLLDNSMIVYGSGIADGNRHNHDGLPILLAGKGGGTITTGRHIQYEKETPLTNLYLAMLDRMGAPAKQLGDSTGKLEYLNG